MVEDRKELYEILPEGETRVAFTSLTINEYLKVIETERRFDRPLVWIQPFRRPNRRVVFKETPNGSTLP